MMVNAHLAPLNSIHNYTLCALMIYGDMTKISIYMYLYSWR